MIAIDMAVGQCRFEACTLQSVGLAVPEIGPRPSAWWAAGS
jgi:hypothetical protein